MQAHGAISSEAADYLAFLAKGQLPPAGISLVRHAGDAIIDGIKYSFGCGTGWAGVGGLCGGLEGGLGGC